MTLRAVVLRAAGVAPDVITFNAILDAVACRPLKARQLWMLGLERGVYKQQPYHLLCKDGHVKRRAALFVGGTKGGQ